jgi:hypothetical protein
MGSTKNRREELRDILLGICENVYYCPPSGHKLKYPCIIYDRRYTKTEFANNKPYTLDTSYTITVIDKNPDSEITPQIERLEKCSFDRHFVTDNLYHDVFTIYH